MTAHPPRPAEALPSGALPLEDWGVIRAAGADALSFLHSQLTQDVLHLAPGQAAMAGFCSAKGRLQASFLVWRDGPQDVLLACSADLLPAVLKRLSMFVLRAQCKLSDVSQTLRLWGVVGEEAARAAGLEDGMAVGAVRPRGEGIQVIRLPDAQWGNIRLPRWLCTGPMPENLPPLAPEAWRACEVLSGVPRITAATVEQFVPQMVNLELVGGVNFRKGCYPGQEVVARSQYRGTLKRRAWALESTVALQPGQELFHSEDPGQPAGMVVLAGTVGPRHVALAELKIAATQSGSLHAVSTQGPALKLLPLPYAVPTEQSTD